MEEEEERKLNLKINYTTAEIIKSTKIEKADRINCDYFNEDDCLFMIQQFRDN